MSGWTDEEWARRARSLGTADRESRIRAVRVLLQDTDALSDPLESELLVLLECLRDVTPPGRA